MKLRRLAAALGAAGLLLAPACGRTHHVYHHTTVHHVVVHHHTTVIQHPTVNLRKH